MLNTVQVRCNLQLNLDQFINSDIYHLKNHPIVTHRVGILGFVLIRFLRNKAKFVPKSSLVDQGLCN